MTDAEAMAKASRAAMELEIVTGAFEVVRAAALEELVNVPPDQTRKIDRLIMTAQIIDSVRKAVENVVSNGTVAKARLELAQAGILQPH